MRLLMVLRLTCGWCGLLLAGVASGAASAPATGPASRPVAWGEPVGGLRIGFSPVDPAVVGEAVTLRFHVENVGRDRVRLLAPLDLLLGNGWVTVKVTGEEVDLATTGPIWGVGPTARSVVELAPGESLSAVTSLRKQSGKAWLPEKAAEIRLVATLAIQPSYAKREWYADGWTGPAVSGELAIDIKAERQGAPNRIRGQASND